jgi:hypothetical protein
MNSIFHISIRIDCTLLKAVKGDICLLLCNYLGCAVMPLDADMVSKLSAVDDVSLLCYSGSGQDVKINCFSSRKTETFHVNLFLQNDETQMGEIIKRN